MVDAANNGHGVTPRARRVPTSPCDWSESDGPPPSVLGAAIARIGAPLLHQQCWCWGWDIRAFAGNLLLARGFTRVRTPEARDSTYTLHLPGGRSVVLWGWGAFYGDPAWGGVFLKRCGFDPCLTVSAEAPSTAIRLRDLPPLASPAGPDDWSRLQALLPPLLRWIADYEVWVQSECGPDYRRLSLRGCPRFVVRRPIAAARIVDTWRRLADECAESAGRPAELRSA